VAQLTAAGTDKVFREVASGAKTDRAQLARALAQLHAGDVLLLTRLDRLARSTRDLLNTFATITERKAGFRSLGDTWADTTTAHGRLISQADAEIAGNRAVRRLPHATCRILRDVGLRSSTLGVRLYERW
jgi:DNA invertase Pin-like site-specific DNA recombinase